MPARTNKWLVWCLLIGLLLGLFFIAKLVAHRTALEIVGPYLATFVAPISILVLLSSWLRKWETHRPSPRLLAFCWSLNVAIFVAAIDAGLLYYGTKFKVISPTVFEAVFVIAACVLSAAIPMYYQVLPVIRARAVTSAGQ